MFNTIPFSENAPLYTLHEMQHAALAPIRIMAYATKHFMHHPANPWSQTQIGRKIAAASEIVERMTRRYSKPAFGIDEVKIANKTIAITEHIIDEKPFCQLLHFRKETQLNEPKLLIVAPLSGHYATLLRGTVRDMLPHADIYITDWQDARDVPLHEGKFDLHDYIDYVIDHIKILGPNIHVMAVCQPSVPVFAAVSALNAAHDEDTPLSMILIGGPIDTRENPTEVNKHAMNKPIEWFERNVITLVPANYPGFMRRVYPGFMQLTGFMSMNMERHIGAHLDLFKHLVEGDGESAEAHRKFYNEYLAVMDITAEFYLQTVEEVFQKHSIPKGQFVYRDEVIKPVAITKTALLTIEGERDDISGVGQTKAAHKLCTSLPKNMQQYHLQKGVGHYGTFNGSKFRKHIVPVITKFINKHNKQNQ